MREHSEYKPDNPDEKLRRLLKEVESSILANADPDSREGNREINQERKKLVELRQLYEMQSSVYAVFRFLKEKERMDDATPFSLVHQRISERFENLKEKYHKWIAVTKQPNRLLEMELEPWILAHATMERLEAGIKKFGIDPNDIPFNRLFEIIKEYYEKLNQEIRDAHIEDIDSSKL